jgi:hypothetical protein
MIFSALQYIHPWSSSVNSSCTYVTYPVIIVGLLCSNPCTEYEHFYLSKNIRIMEDDMSRLFGAHWDKKCMWKFLVKCEGQRSFRRPRYRWEIIIKVDPKKMGCGVLDCIYLAQFRVHRYHNEPLCFWSQAASWSAKWPLASQERDCSISEPIPTDT